jgi:hypothetical protein
MGKKPEDFKITGETGVKTVEEPFFEYPVEARMTGCILESQDYGNEKRFTLEFERHNSKAVFDPIRDYISFYRHQEVKDIIRELINLAARLQASCVDAIQE